MYSLDTTRVYLHISLIPRGLFTAISSPEPLCLCTCNIDEGTHDSEEREQNVCMLSLLKISDEWAQNFFLSIGITLSR